MKKLLSQLTFLTLLSLVGVFTTPISLGEGKLLKSVQAQTVEGQADRLFQQGIQQYNTSQLREAAQSWQEALRLYQEINNRAGIVNSLNNLGVVSLNLGNYEEAIDYHQRSLQIAEELGARAGISASLNNLGETYRNLGNYEEAINYYQRSLVVDEELGDRAGVSASLNNLGAVSESLGNYEEAIDYYQRSLVIDEELGDRAGIAKVLNNLGNVSYGLGNYEEAIDYLQRSSTIFEELGNSAGVSTSLNNLGGVSESLGEYEEALNYHQRSLALAEEIGDRAGVADSLNNLGIVSERLGEYEEAIDYYQRSLALAEEIGDRAGVVSSLNNLGAISLELGEYEEALNYHQRSLALAEEIGDRAGVATSLNALGSVSLELGVYEEAREQFQRSLAIAEEIGARAGIAGTYNNIALLLKQQNQATAAIVFYKESVNRYEQIREDLKGLSTKQQQSYINTIEKTYRNLVDLLIQQDRILEAQRVLDLLKIQELDDFLEDVRGNENTKQGVAFLPPETEILSGYQTIINQAVEVSQQLTPLQQINPDNRTPQQRQTLAILNQQYQDILAQLTPYLQSSPVQQALAQLTPQTIRTVEQEQITALQNDLQSLEQNAVLLYSAIFDDRLELILTTPDAPPIHKTVLIDKAELNQAILDFREALDDPFSDAVTPAQTLYNLVIKPIEAELEAANAEVILYAPDTQFRYIPLAALHDGEKWLTQTYQINQITALSLTDFQRPSQSETTILAGAFAHGSYEFEVGGTEFNFSGLSGAEAEVKIIDQMFPTTTFIDTEFSTDNTVPQMDNHRIVHFATHAAFVVGRPEESFILFGDGTRTNLREVERNWTLTNVDLVVLSACETGVNGEFGKGQEILGFGYLMQLAGARASLSSLWEVSDAGTQVLMSIFYEQLQESELSIAEALQQAQIALINNDETVITTLNRGLGVESTDEASNVPETGYSHPFYWSPFILIGNGL
ncbi:UNVERIFIED_CONTAM: hypothetical protein BEN50_02830 [Euhalothece sp. KZN 001]